MKPVKINSFEVWVADHAVPVFVVVATAIVLGAGGFLFEFQRQGDTQHEVDVLRPKVTKIVHAASVCNAKSIKRSRALEACASRLRFALVACRAEPRCRASLLAIVNYPPPARLDAHPALPNEAPGQKGGATQTPSNHGHQHPGPAKGPSGDHHHATPAPSPIDATPAPAPAPTPSPPAAGDTGPGNSGEHSQGNGPPQTPPGQTKKGLVEAETCLGEVCVEVGVGG